MSRGYMKKCSTGLRPKRQHPTQSAAEGQRRSLVAQGVWTMAGSNTYFCNQCGWYHAGKLGRGNRGKGRAVAAKNRPRHLATQ